MAGGSGLRYGAHKQFLELAGRPVVAWSADAARRVAEGVVVVVPAAADVPASAGRLDAEHVVAGGPTRSASVRAGLAVVPADADIVVVHDAVRPLAPPSLFDAVVGAVRDGADGAVPALPVGDTLKRVEDDAVVTTVDRRNLFVVQTPQAFASDVLRRAHESGADATDDAALLETLGATVRVVEGDPRNLKITRSGDLELLEALVRAMAPHADG